SSIPPVLDRGEGRHAPSPLSSRCAIMCAMQTSSTVSTCLAVASLAAGLLGAALTASSRTNPFRPAATGAPGIAAVGAAQRASAAASSVPMPGDARMALSLSFDDGRASQVDVGLDVFARHDARVTLYVVPSAVEARLDGWKRAVAAGHEIGNHSLTHSCSGNFPFAREKALEQHTLARMRAELVEANERIAALLGTTPRTFAYPCGQTFVGRGRDTRSYVPVVAE